MECVKRNQPLGIGSPFLDLVREVLHETDSALGRGNSQCKQVRENMPDQAIPGGHSLRVEVFAPFAPNRATRPYDL